MSHSWQYYDVLLLAIALSLGIGAMIGSVTPVSLPVAAVVSGAVGVALIGHGLFVNGPVDSPEDLAEPVDTPN